MRYIQTDNRFQFLRNNISFCFPIIISNEFDRRKSKWSSEKKVVVRYVNLKHWASSLFIHLFIGLREECAPSDIITEETKKWIDGKSENVNTIFHRSL